MQHMRGANSAQSFDAFLITVRLQELEQPHKGTCTSSVIVLQTAETAGLPSRARTREHI